MLFTGRVPPNLVQDYDVIGFDADHCIVKYNLHTMTRLLSKITADDMVNKFGYPAQITQFDDSLSGISLNNVVWDIEKRTLLKLGEGKVILRALRGTQRLTDEQVTELYGSPPVF